MPRVQAGGEVGSTPMGAAFRAPATGTVSGRSSCVAK